MGKETRRQEDKGTRRRGNVETGRFEFVVSLSPTPLVPLSPTPLFPFIFTGYIWSYQNSRSFSRNQISRGTSRLDYEEQETHSDRRDCFRRVNDRGAAMGAIVLRRCGLRIEGRFTFWQTAIRGQRIRNPQSAIRNQTLGVHRAYAPRLAASQKRKLGQNANRSIHPRAVGEGRFNAFA